MDGCADRGCLSEFDRTPNAGKFLWGRSSIDYLGEAFLVMAIAAQY
jgi:hypothetical protein